MMVSTCMYFQIYWSSVAECLGAYLTSDLVVYRLFMGTFLAFLHLSEVRVGFGAPNYVATEGDGLANITVIKDGSSTESVIILLSSENINATGKNFWTTCLQLQYVEGRMCIHYDADVHGQLRKSLVLIDAAICALTSLQVTMAPLQLRSASHLAHLSRRWWSQFSMMTYMNPQSLSLQGSASLLDRQEYCSTRIPQL